MINSNIGASCLHGALLIALLVYYFIETPGKTSVNLFDEKRDLFTNETSGNASGNRDNCKCWPDVGYFSTEFELDIFWMTVVFTGITFLAHCFYAGNKYSIFDEVSTKLPCSCSETNSTNDIKSESK